MTKDRKLDFECHFYSKLRFLAPAKRFLKRLAEEVKDLQYPNGPIIAAQVENEYGSYGANHKYVDSIALALKDYGITKALLYTTDGPWGIDGGKSTYAYPTVDFGPTPCDLIGGNFLIQRQFAKCGPHVNSEFYTGWFDGWNLTKHGYPSIEKIIGYY
jgi:beta-galactosidase